MDSAQSLLTLIISLIGIATLETIILFVCRRDVKLGLKKWFLQKFGRRPMAIRIHGADMTVKEYIVGTRGKVDIQIEKMRFFLKQKAIRKRDDSINEINFTYKNVRPINPDAPAEEFAAGLSPTEEILLSKLREKIPLTKEERDTLAKLATPERKPWIKIKLKKGETANEDAGEPLDYDEAPQGPSPTELDQFIEFMYLVAKAQALKAIAGLDKWIKGGAFAAGLAAILAFLAWYTNKDLMPLVQAIGAKVDAIIIFLTPAATEGAKALLNATLNL